jgi:hypothetical protein
LDPLIKSQQTGDPQGIQIFDSGGRDPPRATRIEAIASVQRRRRWSTEEEVRIVRHRAGALHDPAREPTIEWHG